jgi:hypothetical protein
LNSRTDRIFRIALIAAFALPLFVYLYLGIFSRFIADDYCVANKVIENGLWGAVVYDYNNWFGRVSESFTSSLAALLGPHLSPINPTILLTTWFTGLVWLVYELSSLMRLRTLGHVAVLTTCLILCAVLAGSPQIYQSLYWLNSIYTYAASLALLPYAAAIVLHAHRNRWTGIRRSLGIVGIFTLAIAAAAFSEPFAAAQTLAFAGWLIVILITTQTPRHPISAYVFAALIGSVVAVFVLLAAPGNAIRQMNFQRASSLFSSAADSLIHAAAFMVASVSSFSPGGALAALFFPALVAYWHTPAELLESIPRRRLRIAAMASIVAGFALIAAFMFPAMYATSQPPPARAYIIPQFFLVCCFAAAGWVIGMYIRKTIPHPSPDARTAVSVLAVLLLGFGPILTTVQALTLTAPLSTFAAEFDQRDALIRAAAARGETTLTVAPLTVDVGERVGLETIGADPEFWVNGCAARYYGLEAIVAE